MFYECEQFPYRLSTNPQIMDLEVIQKFLNKDLFGATSLSQIEVAESLQDDLCFGLYHTKEQIGFASITTDFATFAYLSDVFILEKFRGKGLGKWFIEIIVAHPDLQQVQQIILLTDDAQGFYTQLGFKPLKDQEGWMERSIP